MPEHPPPPPPPKKQSVIDYIKDVVNGDYSDKVKVKAIKKAVK